MTQAELFQLLKTTGLPVAFYEFLTPPSLPYIVYLTDGTDAYGSDDRNEIKQAGYLIELYSKHKDLASQQLIETVLNDKGIKYTSHEQKIASENLYQVSYHISFTKKIRRV